MVQLKQQLKTLAENDLPKLFTQFREVTAVSPAELNEIIQLEIRFRSNESEYHGGRVSLDDYRLEYNRILNAVLFRIDALKAENFSDTPKSEQHVLHDYHRYTCDRIDQSDRFQQFFSERRNEKVHFFYLYGMDVQSHGGMFKRIAFDLEGRLRDYLNPGMETGCKSIQVEMTLGVGGDPEVYKQNILKDLFAALSVRVNEHEPLTRKNITWLRENSPVLQGLGASDYVCIFAGISQWDWDKEMTPAITRWFINEFCQGDLPEDSPTYLFFFAIIYEEDDSQIEQEVEAVISQATSVHALPELNMVQMRDIGAWFSRYKFIASSASELKNMRQQYFGQAGEYVMEDVEIKLKQLIDEYNRKFL